MQGNLSQHADIASYQLFAYQEGLDPLKVNGSVWKRVGYARALPLPIACTHSGSIQLFKSFNFLGGNSSFFFLKKFLERHRYHFAVRAMDAHGRPGPYSEPGTIVLSWDGEICFLIFLLAEENKFRLLLTLIFCMSKNLLPDFETKKLFFSFVSGPSSASHLLCSRYK